MPRVRAIKGPPTSFIEIGDGRSMRMVAGSMGAAQPQGGPEPAFVDTAMEPGSGAALDNDAYARMVRQREAAEGLPEVAAPQVEYVTPPMLAPPLASGGITFADRLSQPRADLSPLPERFSLDIERKPDGWWVVRAPGVHIGLFVAHQDLTAALADAPGALAGIVRLDGLVTARRRRK
jgi:hypothetical protein